MTYYVPTSTPKYDPHSVYPCIVTLHGLERHRSNKLIGGPASFLREAGRGAARPSRPVWVYIVIARNGPRPH